MTMCWVSRLSSWLKEKQSNLSKEMEVDDLNRWKKQLEDWEVALENNYKKKELDNKEKRLNSRRKALCALSYFRLRIRFKKCFLEILIFFLAIVITSILGVLMGLIPNVINSSLAISWPDNIKSFLNVISGVSKEIGAIVVMLILLLSIVLGLYIMIKSCHRYQNAIHKLNVLIMRLKLYTDKDLGIPSRLDRELEMIYRILES